MQPDFPTPQWSHPRGGRRYESFIAMNQETVEEAYRLRYRVFAEEMGARLKGQGLDQDGFDPFCDHLVVRDHRSGRVVATSRLLSDQAAVRAGRFYAEQEFDLGAVANQLGRLLEVGRTCIDPASRGTAVLSILWSGLARYAIERGFEYLIGCASIPPGPGGFAVEAFRDRLQPEQIGPQWLNVVSLRPVPKELRTQCDECGIPPLLQTYLRLGAWICGEPFWDEDFNCMDVFILLPLVRLNSRYARRFLRQQPVHHELA